VNDEQIDAKIKEVHDRRGYLVEWHLFFAEEIPEVLDAYEGLYKAAKISDGLPEAYRECVYSAVLSSRGEDDLAKNHMHKALNAGATRRELTDAILVAFNPTGALTLCHGFKSLIEVLVERGEYQHRDVPYRVTDRDSHSGRLFTEAGAR
jgi:alkylhydroperoxidase/carboxymuconolactone decarboxylase family protein YurZ